MDPCSQAPKGLACCCCRRCGIAGCDLRSHCGSDGGIGCCYHSRCYPLQTFVDTQTCPICGKHSEAITIIPMSFQEIDQAHREAAKATLSDKRGKKRINATIIRLNPTLKADTDQAQNIVSNHEAELRIGRWTDEETQYCDYLIHLYQQGKLPIPEGAKLNEFLASILKSKQARLTKKMKKAKLSTHTYEKTTGYIDNVMEAQHFSRLESNFFASIKCHLERAEIRFHMQKIWRELFCAFSRALPIKIHIDQWILSLDEMERRRAVIKDAARIKRRKVLMGYALDQDMSSSHQGVFIDPHASDRHLSSIVTSESTGRVNSSLAINSSSLADRVMAYVQKTALPFEHVDVWVPAMTPAVAGVPISENKCRLCFAGCATTDSFLDPRSNQCVELKEQEQFDLLSFGEYSQKFSFDIGIGLPGRVYEKGEPEWAYGLDDPTNESFLRRGGAIQWGIRCALAIPVPSAKVGRIVVVFYSKVDRSSQEGVKAKLESELMRLIPLPRWRLVVEVGCDSPDSTLYMTSEEETNSKLLSSMIEQALPQNGSNRLVDTIPLATELMHLLQKETPDSQEIDNIREVLTRFMIYRNNGLSPEEIAWQTVNDFARMKCQRSEESFRESIVAPTLCEKTCSRESFCCDDDCPESACNDEPLNVSVNGDSPKDAFIEMDSSLDDFQADAVGFLSAYDEKEAGYRMSDDGGSRKGNCCGKSSTCC